VSDREYTVRLHTRPAGKTYHRIVVIEVQAQSESEARRKAIARVESENACVMKIDYCYPTRAVARIDYFDMQVEDNCRDACGL
jgi:hypothetical protein